MGMRHNLALSDKKRPKQHGMYKLCLDYPMRKMRRRQHRKEKAFKLFPRPADGLLRPEVRCETQRYNMRTRLGYGFTKDELLAAGINPQAARTLGIAFDPRRRNHSKESMNANVERLKAYKAKLIIFPRKAGKTLKTVDLAKDKTLTIGEKVDRSRGVYRTKQLGLDNKVEKVKTAPVTKEMKNLKAFVTLKSLRKERRNIGKRMKFAEKKNKKE